jgi:hypothetical protein
MAAAERLQLERSRNSHIIPSGSLCSPLLARSSEHRLDEMTGAWGADRHHPLPRVAAEFLYPSYRSRCPTGMASRRSEPLPASPLTRLPSAPRSHLVIAVTHTEP